MCNVKAPSLTIQKLWPMLKLFADKQKDGKTDKTVCPGSIDVRV